MPDVRFSNGEPVLNLGDTVVQKATDPLTYPQPYVTPGDFAAQYPTPLDPTEVIAMCEEISAWNNIPEEKTALKQYTWRELNALAFTSGSTYISFADGECPEEFSHGGDNTTITLKNIGAKKSLSQSDIMHSAALAAANWGGINKLIGGIPSGEGTPGGYNTATFAQEQVADVKEKEVRLAMTLVMNGWDKLLVQGSVNRNALEFDGIEYQVTEANGSHTNDGLASATGTFSATAYNRFLADSCAKPTHIWGAPQAVQELMTSYFQLGFQGSQLVNFSGGDRIVPGFNFAGFVNTGVGRVAVVADNNFTKSNEANGEFTSALYGLRMVHNGTPLVHRITQIPLAFKDLVAGCTAVSFEVWAKTALIVKHRCAHSKYTARFAGSLTTTCTTIG